MVENASATSCITTFRPLEKVLYFGKAQERTFRSLEKVLYFGKEASFWDERFAGRESVRKLSREASQASFVGEASPTNVAPQERTFRCQLSTVNCQTAIQSFLG